MSAPKKKRPSTCPCGSGVGYRACCGPLHDGAPAPSAAALMRSRYTAFALGRAQYLVDTLHPDHVDLRRGAKAVLAAVQATIRHSKFLGLRVLDADERGEEAEVLFHARVFQKGRDQSFVERSRFRQVEGAWRYASGELVPRARWVNLDRLTLATLSAAPVDEP